MRSENETCLRVASCILHAISKVGTRWPLQYFEMALGDMPIMSANSA